MALTVALAIVGALLAVTSLFWLLKHNVHGRVFADVLLKLLQANNRDRALKLCHAIASSPYYTLAHGALMLRVPTRDPKAGTAADYRSSVEERPFELRVRDALFDLMVSAMQPVERHAMRTVVGCALLGAASALAAARALLPIYQAVGAGLIALALAVLTVRMRWRTESELAYLRDILEPWVERGRE